jgi:O-antigen ligase/polysaccharide polymerase Wzy-like membrane protein
MPSPDSIRLILTVLSLVFLVGMVIRPVYGLFSYLIIMMVRPGVFYPALGAVRIELAAAILVLVVMALSPGRLERLQIKEDPIIKWMFILFGIMLLSMLQAMDFKYSWDWMWEFAKIFAFFIMVVTLLDSKQDIRIFLWMFGIATCMLSYDAIYNYFTGTVIERIGDVGTDYAVTSGGMGSGHVALANITLQAMPFLWYLGVMNKNVPLKLGGAILFSISLYAVIVSGSRGGFVGLLSLLVCLSVFSRRKILMALLGVGLLFSMPFIAGSKYIEYMETVKDFGSSSAGLSSSSRISGLRNGIEMMIRRPVLGVGPGCYPIARKAWFGWGLWAHNLYGELMGDLGAIGTAAWFMFIYSYWKPSWRFIKQTGVDPDDQNLFTAVLVATIVRLVIGMGSHSVYIFFWYMIAAVVAVDLRIFKNKSIELAAKNV